MLKKRVPIVPEQALDIAEHENGSVKIGPLSFLTAWSEHGESGDRMSQTARRHRKVTIKPLIHKGNVDPADAIARVEHQWQSLIDMNHLSWWIAIAFMIGASGFMLGCLAVQWPLHLPDQLTRPRAVTWIFITGAIFFTLAAFLQWIQSMKNGLEPDASGALTFRFLRTLDLGYWACLIQFAGTLFFNLNTLDALLIGLSPIEQDVFIWTPNLAGSLCFLLASQLAAMEYAHGWFRWAPGEISWWIVYINLLGSILFGVSVGGSFVMADGDAAAASMANLTTLAGAVCFFVAAYLLIPEAQEKAQSEGA